MGSRRAAAVYTDPPYNVKIDGHATGNGATRHREFAMASGEMSEAEFVSFLNNSLRLLAQFSANNADARFLRFNSFYGETEDNYMAGPRYLIRRRGKLQPYAQCLAGMGKIQYPFQIGAGSYLALAPGAGANYRIARRWSLRGEYEYQFWPGSPNVTNQPAHQITPSGFHAGLVFRLLK